MAALRGAIHLSKRQAHGYARHMIYEHLGARPRIHDTAVVAPSAVISGDVTIGENCQVLHGAVITAEGGPITLGEHVIVMENALIRATVREPRAHRRPCAGRPDGQHLRGDDRG